MAVPNSVVDFASYRRTRLERAAAPSFPQAVPAGYAMVWVPVWFPMIAPSAFARPQDTSWVGDDQPAG